MTEHARWFLILSARVGRYIFSCLCVSASAATLGNGPFFKSKFRPFVRAKNNFAWKSIPSNKNYQAVLWLTRFSNFKFHQRHNINATKASVAVFSYNPNFDAAFEFCNHILYCNFGSLLIFEFWLSKIPNINKKSN